MKHYSVSWIFVATAFAIAFCVIFLPKLLELLTRRARAKRAVKQRPAKFFILTDDITKSRTLQQIAEWLEQEFDIKPTISAKLPHGAGDDIVTIEEVHSSDNGVVCVIEHMNYVQPLQYGVCQCPMAFTPCRHAVLNVLTAT